ncbi:MAG: hypothetical protein KF681_07830 [Bdellovibrionaceae bacterium]|nr:hypothetical protein [Pseudobdellovibrionaceae bacterium]
MDWRLVTVTFLLFSLLIGCRSPTLRERMEARQSSARPSPATYGMDGFYNDLEFPDRDKPRPLDFFYKHCNLSGRSPYPSSQDWECSEPQ